MSIYTVTIECWPHSTGRGNTVDQKQAGLRSQDYEVCADSIKEAMQVADAICVGLTQNPVVWQTPITSIVLKEIHQSRPQIARPLKERGECYMEKSS
jgi:hypothetical protein